MSTLASPSYPVSLRFLGAAQTVTGSKHLLSFGQRRIMIDAGLFQGDKKWRRQNWADFSVDPAGISDILLTHAHMDHVGYLPALVKQGFRGTVWCTRGTRDLAEIVLRDAANLQVNEAKEAARGGYSKHKNPQPLYDENDVDRALPLFRTVAFDDDIDLGDGALARYTRAGHILGSASIRVWAHGDDEHSVLFSGDLGRPQHPVLKAREIPQGASSVCIESTYGDREHSVEGEASHDALAELINRTIKRGGNILIPAFAVDRTEVVLKVLGQMLDAGRIPYVPIYVNSPMGTAALGVYQTAAAAGELRDDIDINALLKLPNLHEIRSKEESIKLNQPDEPSIIISSSGMATGGRVVHHLQHMLPDERNAVVFTGYQAHGTRGRSLVQGATQLKMFGQYVPVNAQVLVDDEFSVHADGSELVEWIAQLSPAPKVVYVVHGEPDSSTALAQRIHRELGIMAVAPKYEEVVRL